MAFQIRTNIDSGEDEYVVSLGDMTVRSSFNQETSDNELCLDEDSLHSLYLQLKEIVCQ